MNQSTAPKRKQNVKGAIRGVMVSACFVATAAALAVDAPYSDNFDSYPTNSMPNNFSTHTSGGGVFFLSDWEIKNDSGTAGVYHNNVRGDFVGASAAVNVANLAQSDFLLSTTFVVNGYGFIFQPTLMNIRVGLGALGSSADFSTSGYQLSYQLSNNGNSFPAVGALELYKGGFIVAGTTFTGLPVVAGTTYTMTLMGDYSPSGLLLMATLSDGSNSLSFATNDPTPPQGTYFGYYDSALGTFNHAVSLDVSYDDFSISVPEPRVTWLLGFGIVIAGVCSRARRPNHRFSARSLSSSPFSSCSRSSASSSLRSNLLLVRGAPEG